MGGGAAVRDPPKDEFFKGRRENVIGVNEPIYVCFSAAVDSSLTDPLHACKLGTWHSDQARDQYMKSGIHENKAAS